VSAIIREWHPEAVRAMVMKQLSGNAEAVGIFVEQDARRRLNAIARPDNRRAVNYRRFLARWGLTHVVRILANAVDIRVGMRTRPVGMKKEPKRADKYHGFYIEVGSRTAPAQPYLRPAVFQNAREIVRLLAGRV